MRGLNYQLGLPRKSPETATAAKGVPRILQEGVWLLLTAALVATSSCAGTSKKKEENDFTSDSRAADLQARQDVSSREPAGGAGEAKKDSTKATHKPLFDRLGGEQRLTAIVNEFTLRVLRDPRVNWDRQGVKKSGLLGHHETVLWQPTPENVALLKKHLVQFLSLTTGGPAIYHGNDLKRIHADMKITAPEFDAAVGDLKASLDRLQVPEQEQKDLLAIVESTRPEIVSETQQ